MPAAGGDGKATSRVYVTGVVLREEAPLVDLFTFPLVSSWFSIYSISGFLVPVEGQQLRQPNKAHKTAGKEQTSHQAPAARGDIKKKQTANLQKIFIKRNQIVRTRISTNVKCIIDLSQSLTITVIPLECSCEAEQ